MEAHHERTRILRPVPLLHVPGPDTSRRAELGDLLEEIVVNVPEERQTRRERIDVQAACNSALHVGESVGKCKRELLRRRCTRFSDVVAADRDRVPPRHVLRGPLEAIYDKSQGWLYWIHPGVLRHVLFENVVLDGPAQFPRIDALLFRRRDVEAVEDDGGPIDGHRSRDLIERDSVEEHLHVGEAGYCHATFADLSLGPGMVRVVTHQRWEIERDGETGLAMGEQKLVSLIRVACAAKAGELPHGP